MKTRVTYLISLVLIIFFKGAVHAQGVKVIWKENFNTTPDWTINGDGAVVVPGSTPANGTEPNQWIFNDIGSAADLYDGTQNLHVTCFSLGCDGQPGIPPGAPVYSSIEASNKTAIMNTSIAADSFPAGLTHKIRFFWKCRGGSPFSNGVGKLIYSVNNGSSWDEFPKNYFNSGVFRKDSIEINPTNFPGFVAGVTSLRFGFRWANALALFGASDPPMIVDEMSIVRTIPPTGITLTSVTNNPSTGPLNPIEVCPGQNILANFIAIGIFPPNTVYTLQLSEPTGIFLGNPTVIGSGLTSPISATVPVGIASGSNYKIRIVSSNAVISGNMLNFNILPSVVPNISVSANPATGICPGTPVNYTSQIQNGGTNPTYIWLVDNQIVSGANGPTLNFSPTLNQSVKAILISNAKCVNPDKDTSESVLVSFLTPQPPVSKFLVLPDSNICPGSSVTLKAKPELGGTNPIFRWFRNGNLLPGATDSVLIFIPNHNDKIYVELTSNAPCVSPQTANSKTTTIRHVAPGNPTISISASGQPSICLGDSVSFSASIQGGGPSPGYRWLINEDTVSTSSSFKTRNLANGDSVRAMLISSLGCAIPRSKLSTAIKFEVKPRLTPEVVISTAAPNVCSGQTMVIRIQTSLGGGSAPTYNWFVNASIQPTSADSLRYFSVAGDSVFVRMTSNETCVTGSQTISNKIFILAKPAISLPSDTTLDIRDTLVLKGNPVGGIWNGRGLNGNLLIGRSAGLGIDTISYSVVSTNGCKAEAIRLITIFKSEQVVFDGFSPNDDGDNDTWKALSDIEDYPNAVVTIYNRYGVEVFRSKKGYPKPWWDGNSADGKALPAGSYFFIIEPGPGKEAIKGKLKMIR